MKIAIPRWCLGSPINLDRSTISAQTIDTSSYANLSLQPAHDGFLRLIEEVHERSERRGVIPPHNIVPPAVRPHPQSERISDWARALGDAVDRALAGRHYPRHVVVPLAAFDLASAVAAFRKTPYFVASDRHPVLLMRNEDPLPIDTRVYPVETLPYEIRSTPSPERRAALVEYDQLFNKSGGWLSRIIGRMMQVFPDFRVRLIQYFIESKLARYSIMREFLKDVCNPCHCIMSFDFGEGTQPKTALFISSILTSTETLSVLLYLDVSPKTLYETGHLIDISFADGLFIKGCGKVFSKRPAQNLFLEHMRRNRGTIVDGKYAGQYEFGTLPDEITSFANPSFRLSYETGMRVSTFSSRADAAARGQDVSRIASLGGLVTFGYSPMPISATSERTQPITLGDLVRVDRGPDQKSNDVLQAIEDASRSI